MARGVVRAERLPKMRLGLTEVTLNQARQAEYTKADHPFSRATFVVRFAPKGLCGFPRQGPLAAPHAAEKLRVIDNEPFGGIVNTRRQFPGAGEGGPCLLCNEALGPHHRLGVVSLKFQPLTRRGNRWRSARCAFTSLVRHLDGLAEMRDCIVEGGTL